MKLNLYEKYLTGGNFNTDDPKDYVEIFVNPSRKDFRDAANSTKWETRMAKYGDYVRFFIATKTKNVYIWKPDIPHIDVAEHIFGGTNIRWNTDDRVSGVAILQDGKWTMIDSDSHKRAWDRLDLEWADKYIDTVDYFRGKRI